MRQRIAVVPALGTECLDKQSCGGRGQCARQQKLPPVGSFKALTKWHNASTA